ncbi:MAG: F0F1 ATP synthase subunit delta [Burkholderiales bacterium]|nr:F0F1 ATP synthase subunit delta [Burkholderiales bacterium]
MLIDWFTVGAQALNFVVLVWLLKRFLYQPVLDAIDAREARIAKQLGDAQATQHDAQTQRDALRQKADGFDRERAGLLAQATQAAAAERERLLNAARQAADELGAKRREALEAEASHLDRELGERARREVFAISRKVLTDLAATSLDERIADVFMRHLRALDETARAELATALQASAQTARIRSAFDLPAAQQAAIQAAVDDTFGATVALRFETAADLVSGIELVAGGQKLSWSIAHHLEALEHLVTDVVAPQPEVAPIAPMADPTRLGAT